MPAITTRYHTPDASKYMHQLCKHFAHKVAVELSENEASVAFPFGKGHFTCDDTTLTITCEVENPELVSQAVFVIEVHLLRFAWHEDVTLDWIDAVSGAAVPLNEKCLAGLQEQRDKNQTQRTKRSGLED